MSDLIPRPPWVGDRPIPRRRRHQLVFTAAGVYNIAWGTYTILNPPVCLPGLPVASASPASTHPSGLGNTRSALDTRGEVSSCGETTQGDSPHPEERRGSDPSEAAEPRCP
jgi:hypothetical protein